MKKISATIIFKHWTRSAGQWSLNEGEQSGKLAALAYCPVSRPLLQPKPSNLSDLRRWSWGSGEARAARSHREREGCYVEIYGEFLLTLNTWDQEMTSWKKQAGQSLGPTRAGSSLCSRPLGYKNLLICKELRQKRTAQFRPKCCSGHT